VRDANEHRCLCGQIDVMPLFFLLLFYSCSGASARNFARRIFENVEISSLLSRVKARVCRRRA
jgi:hypothetical protein